MENVSNEQTSVLAQATEVEEVVNGEQKAQVSLGKFKDVNALLNAYNSLEAEFTKRCQRLKELEGSQKLEQAKVSNVAKGEEQKNPNVDATQLEMANLDENAKEQSQVSDKSFEQSTLDEKSKEEILKEYLKGVISSKQSAVIMDSEGVIVTSPIAKPKTVIEAGNLAKQILTK